ncbi:MAG TPA: glycosyl hydrolase family 28-related protein [Steroidobacteraceae bacterium]|nr:glycosyl hydrolase family 28-related protein [Steroidobacteraceae bacterium]
MSGQPSAATVVALDPGVTAKVGAPLEFVEYEAENGSTNGRIIGPDRTFATLASEASGRRAVLLEAQQDYVEFTLSAPANALTVRYALPDGPEGKPIEARLSVYTQSRRIGELTLTTRYCCYYGRYPFTKHPADGNGHHFFDHARILLERVLPAGTVVRMTSGPRPQAAWIAIDLVDFEMVPAPHRRPSRALSVVDFGADPFGELDSREAFAKALAAASRSRRPLWVPPGHFRLDGHVQVDRVEIAGAGPWYSVLRGDGVGLYGRDAPNPSQAVDIHDLAIIGQVNERDDHKALAGIGGALGGGSRIRDVFIQHVKVGLWLDGPFDGLIVRHVRVLDTTADGLNLHRGISGVIIEESFFRNNGDDGIASWAEKLANHDIIIRHNTVVAPILANGVAIYGGHDITVSDNLVADILTEGGGLHLGNRFGAVPLSGKISLQGNMVVRGGSIDPRWHFGIGAVWLFALDEPINAQIDLRATTLLDSSQEAVLLFGRRIDGLVVNGLRVDHAGGSLIELRADGSATFSGVRATGIVAPTVRRCSAFQLEWKGSNNGLDTSSSQGCRVEPHIAQTLNVAGNLQLRADQIVEGTGE